MKMNKKILALNLCFVMLFSLFSLCASALNDFPVPVYSITVDGNEFSSDTEQSGNGWNYSKGVLTLDGYNGSTIKASGDLTIYANNNVKVTGKSTSVYSSDNCAIVVRGQLDLTVKGTVTLSGASTGGEAIVAEKANITSKRGCNFNLYGGKSSVAIKANDIVIETSQMNVTGGKDSPAIYFSSTLNIIGNTNAVVKSGSTNKYAIIHLASGKYAFDEDKIKASYENDAAKIVFTANNDFIYGDCNGDGDIGTVDAVLLAQHLAEWKVTIDLDAADANGDGDINISDAVILAQYLADWEIELGTGN